MWHWEKNPVPVDRKAHPQACGQEGALIPLMTYYGGINAINVINPINATNHLCIFVPVSAIADRAKNSPGSFPRTSIRSYSAADFSPGRPNLPHMSADLIKLCWLDAELQRLGVKYVV